MEFGDYTKWCKDKDGNLPTQLNVLALVGNGFDIQALQDLKVQGDTKYESFYHFLKTRKFNKENCIFRVMEDRKWEKDCEDCLDRLKDCLEREENCENCLEQKQKGSDYGNWSDIEQAIQELANGKHSYCRNEEGKVALDKLAQDLSEIQSEFSEFLNQLVTPKVLDVLSKVAQGNDEGKRDKLVDDVNKLLESDYERKYFLILDGMRKVLFLRDKKKEEKLGELKEELENSVNEFARERMIEDLSKLLEESDLLEGDDEKLFDALFDLFDESGEGVREQLLSNLKDFNSTNRPHLRCKIEKVLLGEEWPKSGKTLKNLRFLLRNDEQGRKWLRDVLKKYLWDGDSRKPLTLISFQNFLGDLDEEELGSAKMKDEVDNHIRDNTRTVFNFHFINFNYTFLFDNYIYLDQEQFTPKPYNRSNCNISFHPNPHGYNWTEKSNRDTSHSSLLVTHAPIHPHGIQTVPRSILFGIDAGDGGVTPETYGSIEKHPEWKFAKPYWAQNTLKYGPLIEEADYFIIFGTSLGKTDRWWWESIGERIDNKNDNLEVFLYEWMENGVKDLGCKARENAKEEARKKFAKAAGCDDYKEVQEKVRVVLYDNETERAWLNTNPQRVPVWADRAQKWQEM